MANMFNNIPKLLRDSNNFLHCKVDLPHHNSLVYPQYAASYYEVTSMQSIKLIGKSKKCSHYFYLIPDSKSLAKECESVSYDHEVEELLRELIENLSKVPTMITTSTAISNDHHLWVYLANICAIIEAQFHCNLALLTSRPLQCS